MKEKLVGTSYKEAIKNSTPWDEIKLYDKKNIYSIFGYTEKDLTNQRFLQDITSNLRLGCLVTIVTALTEPTKEARTAAGMFAIWTKAAIDLKLTSSYDMIKYINSTIRDDDELMHLATAIRVMFEKV